jgi:hypothetical protein
LEKAGHTSASGLFHFTKNLCQPESPGKGKDYAIGFSSSTGLEMTRNITTGTATAKATQATVGRPKATPA